MGEPTTPTAPQLPPEAPEDLRDFLECKSAKVALKDGNLSWLPLPPEIKDFVPEGAKPDLAIEPGATPGTASIKVSLGPISLSLPASVSGGQLTVDTSDPAQDVAPAWFPGGTALAFVRDVDGNADIYLMNADGSGVTRLTDDPAEDLDPEWIAAPRG